MVVTVLQIRKIFGTTAALSQRIVSEPERVPVVVPSLAQTSVGPFQVVRCGGFSLHPSAKNLLKVDIHILHSYLNLLL